jgi:hypothetical protein
MNTTFRGDVKPFRELMPTNFSVGSYSLQFQGSSGWWAFTTLNDVKLKAVIFQTEDAMYRRSLRMSDVTACYEKLRLPILTMIKLQLQTNWPIYFETWLPTLHLSPPISTPPPFSFTYIIFICLSAKTYLQHVRVTGASKTVFNRWTEIHPTSLISLKLH